jgi:hypothetical protein
VVQGSAGTERSRQAGAGVMCGSRNTPGCSRHGAYPSCRPAGRQVQKPGSGRWVAAGSVRSGGNRPAEPQPVANPQAVAGSFHGKRGEPRGGEPRQQVIPQKQPGKGAVARRQRWQARQNQNRQNPQCMVQVVWQACEALGRQAEPYSTVYGSAQVQCAGGYPATVQETAGTAVYGRQEPGRVGTVQKCSGKQAGIRGRQRRHARRNGSGSKNKRANPQRRQQARTRVTSSSCAAVARSRSTGRHATA